MIPLKALRRSASWENQILHSEHMPLEGKEVPGGASHGVAATRLLEFKSGALTEIQEMCGYPGTI